MPLSPYGRASFRLRVAVRVRRGVSTIQPYLVRSQPVELDEELFVELHSAVRVRVELHHPTLQPVGIDLLVPRRVQRVGEIDTLAIATDLYHLRAAVECLLGFIRVSRTAHDPAEMNRARLLRVGRVGDVVLDELPGSPA